MPTHRVRVPSSIIIMIISCLLLLTLAMTPGLVGAFAPSSAPIPAQNSAWHNNTLEPAAAPSNAPGLTYLLAPYADPAQIRLRDDQPLGLTADGSLTIAGDGLALTESAPAAWQESGGQRTPATMRFALDDVYTPSLAGTPPLQATPAAAAPARSATAHLTLPRPDQAAGWGSLSTFNAGSTQHTSVAALTATKMVVAYRDNANSDYGTAVVGDISGDTITYGAEYVFHAAATYSYIDVIPLSATRFVVVYMNGAGDNYGMARVGDVSGNTITWGAEAVFNSAQTGYISGAALSATQFVVAYHDGGNSGYGTAQVGTITGSSIAFGSKYVFHTYGIYHASVAALSSTQVVMTYWDASNSYGYAIVGNVSDAAITYGAEYVFDATASQTSVAALTASRFVVVYKDYGNSGAGTAVVGDVSGTAITYGAESVFQTVSDMQSVNILGASGLAALSDSQFVVGYEIYDEDYDTYYGYVTVGSVSGSAIAFGSSTDVNSGSQSRDVAVEDLSASAFAAGWGDRTGNTGQSRLNITLEPEPTNHPTGFDATANSGTQITTSWTDAAGGVTPDGYLALCNTTGAFTDPVDGAAQADDSACADGSGAKNIAQGVGTYAWTALSGATTYYFKIFPYTNSGADINYKTDGAPPTANAATPCAGAAGWGPVATFNAGGTQHTSVAALTATKMVVAYRDNANSDYGTAVVGDISGDTITYGAEYVFHAAATYSFIDVIPLSATRFVVVYMNGAGDNYGMARVGDVSGNTITWGAEAVFNSAQTGYISGAALSATQFVVAYQDGGNSGYGTAQVGAVTGSSIAFGSKYVFHAYGIYDASVAALSSTQVVMTYWDASNSYGYAIVGNVSDAAIAYGAEYVFDATASQTSVAALTASRFVVVYKDGGNSGAGTAVVGDVSGTAITYGAESVFQTVSGGQSVNIQGASGIAALSDSQFVVGYGVSTPPMPPPSGEYGYVVVGSVSGSAIAFGSSTDVNSGSQSRDVAVEDLSASAFAVGWGDRTGNTGQSRLNVSTSAPTVDTPTSAEIGATTATLGGAVSNTGGANVTERGVYWSATSGFTPPGAGTKVSDTGDWGSPGAFTKAVSSLPANTPIYFKAFATNSVCTGFSNQASFTTLNPEPTNHPTGFDAMADSGTQITTSWTDAAGGVAPDGYLLLCNKTGAFTDPVDGVAQTDDTACADGSGVVNIAQGVGTYAWTGLDGATQYYYKIYPYTGSGSGVNYKTDGAPPTANAATHCVAAASGSWSAQFGACPAESRRIIAPGVTVTLDSDVSLTGDFEIQPGGTFNPNGKTVTLSGDAAQTLTGNPLTFYRLVLDKTNKTDIVTVVGKLQVSSRLTITRGKLKSASDYGDILIETDGVLELNSDITVSGHFTNSGDFDANGYGVIFDGAVTQHLAANVFTWFENLTVETGTTLIESVSDDNVLVQGTLTNNGVIRKTQAIGGAGSFNFGIAGEFAGADLLIDVTTDNFTDITVSRYEQDHANASATAGLGRYWNITPTGSGTVNLTLPHDVSPDTNASACRYTGSGSTWTCGRSSSTAGTVTLEGVTSFSDWSVGDDAPLGATLAGFGAQQQGAAILVNWETVSEIGNLGFNLWRGVSPTAPDLLLNSALIPSAAPGSSQGFSYEWLDGADLVSGNTYYYWLEDVDSSGAVTRHGPVSAAFNNAPTAVRLTGARSGSAPFSPVSAIAIAALIAVAWTMKRRRPVVANRQD